MIRFVASTTLAVSIASIAAGQQDLNDWCGLKITPEDAAKALELQLQGAYDLPGRPAGDDIYVVAVAHWVVRRSNGSGGINELKIQQAMETANRVFLPMGIQFCSLPTQYIDDDRFYFMLKEEDTYPGTPGDSHTYTDGAINVYYSPGAGNWFCGRSAFSFMPRSEQMIVMANQCTDSTGVLAHELGHYFDLFHTHETAIGIECADGRNCDDAGDLVCDTPADYNLIFGGHDGCTYVGDLLGPCSGDTPYNPDPRNVMSYAPNICLEYFTPGQHARGLATYLSLRPELHNPNCDGTLDIERISINNRGEEANGPSVSPLISNNGQYVVYESDATNLVFGDGNGRRDLFMRDLVNARTYRVSETASGESGDGDSGAAAMSNIARHIAFESLSSNFVANDTNAAYDVFVKVRATGELLCASVTPGGRPGNGASRRPAISGDGRWLVFQSDASNLVSGDANGVTDIFLRDMNAGTTTRISLGMGGVEANGGSFAPAISSNGRFIAFHSGATNLVPGDTNGVQDVFVYDRVTGETRRVSVSSAGGQANGHSSFAAISDDGRHIVFESAASNLVTGDTNGFVDVFVHDTHHGTTVRASVSTAGGQGDRDSLRPRISAHGRYVTFQSAARGLVDNDFNVFSDVFLHDRDADGNGVFDEPGGTSTTFGAVRLSGDQPDGRSFGHTMTPDGGVIAFDSEGADITDPDTNGVADVFVFDRPNDYTLSVEPLVAGRASTISVRFATPGKRQFLVYSRFGAGQTNWPDMGVVLDLRNPSLLRRGRANASGAMDWEIDIPANALGREIWFQATERNAKTDAVARLVMDQ